MKLEVLIADPSQEIRDGLRKLLENKCRVYTAADGLTAQTLLRQRMPDVLLTELRLPGVDGLNLICQASESPRPPAVLVMARFQSDYVVDKLESLGVKYLLSKPCALECAAERILDMEALVRNEKTPEEHLANLGISSKYLGWTYLGELIRIMIREGQRPITKELYPRVASAYQTDAASVERCVRSAIACAWEHRKAGVWESYFPTDSGGILRRPTNSEFATAVAGLSGMDTGCAGLAKYD